MATERKRKQLTLEEKLRILEEENSGTKRKTDFAGAFGISSSPLSTLIKNGGKVSERAGSAAFDPRCKRLRCAVHEDIDKVTRS